MRRALPLLLLLAACGDSTSPGGETVAGSGGASTAGAGNAGEAAAPAGETEQRPQPPPRAPYAPPAEIWQPPLAAASDEGETALERFTLPEGMTASLWAAEPQLGNPVAFDVDPQGRVFVAETWRQETEGVPDNRTFPEWLHDDLQLHTVEERGLMYLKYHPEFAEQWTDSDDRIVRLADTDGDGVADESLVFAHGFNDLLDGTGAGVLAVGDDVYYTCIPKLWKLTDADGDGAAEGGEALSHGYGVRVAFRGHDMHGLILGPDRKLYFSIGDRGYHVTTDEGVELVDPGRGAVFRCELDGSGLEVYAVGLRNPQELAFDDLGNLWTVDNNCDAGDRARLVYLMEGGDSGWSMNFQYLPDRGPWMSEDWWKPAGEGPDQPAFLNAPLANITSGPSGFAHYPGVGLPAEYAGSFFICDFTGGANSSGVRRFTVKPDGAGYALDEQEMFWGKMLVTDVAFGPDGSMYASDWVEGWIGAGKGRIYRAEHAGADAELGAATAALLAGSFAESTAVDLQILLGHADRRVRLKAQWELVDRGAVAELAQVAAEGVRGSAAPARARLHGIWGLQMLGEAEELLPSLAAEDADVRATAVAAIGEIAAAGGTAENFVEPIGVILRTDVEPRVRYHAALTLGKLGDEAAVFHLIEAARADAGADRFLRHAHSWALAQCGPVSDLAHLSQDADAAVRMAAVLALRLQESHMVVRFLDDEDPAIVAAAARAIWDRRIDTAIPDLAAQVEDSARLTRPALRRALAAANHLGGQRHARTMLDWWGTAEDEKLKEEVQRYLQGWLDPDRFDKILNEAWVHPEGRSLAWAEGRELPFEPDAAPSAEERGKRVFTDHPVASCMRCHALRGSPRTGCAWSPGRSCRASASACRRRRSASRSSTPTPRSRPASSCAAPTARCCRSPRCCHTSPRC